MLFCDSQVHALIAEVESDVLTGIPPTLIKDTAAPLMEVQAALLEDPKVGLVMVVLFVVLLWVPRVVVHTETRACIYCM